MRAHIRVICAPDSFKESMSASAAARAMAAGVHRVCPDADCGLVPMADGGEGTTGCVVDALGGRLVHMSAQDALGRPRDVEIGYVPAERLAVVEMAQAAGLEHISPCERDVMGATSYGVGQMIRRALDLGATRIVLGLGGSACNDGGAGMLTALGGRLTGADGRPLPPGGGPLAGLDGVDLSGLDPRLGDAQFELACDVDNPLLGPRGASAVFGPQKGATPDQAARLDDALARFADRLEAVAGRRVRDLPGTGAAGGLALPLLAVTRAAVRPGVEIIADAVGLATQVAPADWVFTGEGSIDGQTLRGKTPVGVLNVARAAGVPVVMFGGRITDDARPLLGQGVVALVPIVRRPCTLEDALRDGPANLADAAEVVTRLLTA